MKNRTDKTDSNSQNIFNRMLRKAAEDDRGESGPKPEEAGRREELHPTSPWEMETLFKETANVRTCLWH